MSYEFNKQDAFRFAQYVGIQAKAKGRNLIFKICPYCRGSRGDKDTFAINLDNGQFNCFRASCGAKGNMISLSKEFGFDIGDLSEPKKEEYMVWGKFPKPEPKDLAIGYFEKRGISADTVRKYHIAEAAEKEHTICFPFYDEQDNLQCIKFRNTEFKKGDAGNKEWWQTAQTGKKNKMILFGMDNCNTTSNTLVLTEGQIDSMSLAEAGIENAVSVPTGANGFTWIPHCWEFLGRYTELIVFGDNENGHITLLDEMSKRFNGKVYRIPDEFYKGCKDANEILQKHGAEALREAIAHKQQLAVPAIVNLADVKNVNVNDMERIQTGITELDSVIGGYYFGQLILITGLRGDGKSTFASQEASIALHQNISCFAYSGELSGWYYKMWMNRQVAGPNNIMQDTRTSEYYLTDRTLAKVDEFYKNKGMTLFDNTVVGTDEYRGILDVIEQAIKKNGSRALFIDNLMTAIDDDMSSDLYRAQSNFVKQLALFAKKYNVLIFLIAHPRKTSNAEFTNDDVAGSSNITNLVDVVLNYSREKPDKEGYVDENIRVLRVLKNRLTGKLNLQGIRLKYDDASKRIASVNKKFDWKLIDETEQDAEFVDIDMSEAPFS